MRLSCFIMLFGRLDASELMIGSLAAQPSFCDAPGWSQVFADEFTGPNLDTSTWTKDVRGPGDSRTRAAAARAENVWIHEDSLVIKSDGTWNGTNWTNLTSGAVQSKGKKSWGGRTRVCVRAKLPGGGGQGHGTGIWPAHWLMPDDSSCWPCHGEIDIMEMINGDGVLHGTYHWCVNQSCGDGPSHLHHPGQTSFAHADWGSTWHEYAVEYDGESSVAFALDGTVYVRTNHTTSPKAKFWQTPYYAIINSAVGGPHEWPHTPSAATRFPTWHYVDYVRVAQPRSARLVEAAS